MTLFTRNLFSFRRRCCMLPVAALALAISVRADAAKKPDFSRLVVVGDSLAAGFQSFSLYDSESIPSALSGLQLPPGGQKHGFAALVAEQAKANLNLPLLYAPGIPPMLTLQNGAIIRSAPLPLATYRVFPGEQTYNLAVPGVTLGEAIARPFPGDVLNNPIDALAASILATPGNAVLGCGPVPVGQSKLIVSQVSCAVALKPTTILVDIGNNDALQAITFGTPPTSPTLFRAQYRALLLALSVTRATIVVANIPNVTAIPFLMPASACGMTGDYVVPDLTNPNQTEFGPCQHVVPRSAAQVAAAQDAVAAYNTIIAQEAARVGAVVVDFNAMMTRVSNGYPVTFPSGAKVLLVPTFGGGLYSLDAIHPSNSGYAIMANEFINTMNAKLNAKLQPIDVNAVAATDPLILAPQPVQ